MAFSGRANITSGDISSRRLASSTTRHHAMKAENTFKMEPDLKFPCRRAMDIMKHVVDQRLAGQTYDADTSTTLARELADTIRGRVRDSIPCHRYKIVAFVVVGQSDSTALALGSRCVWHEKYDSRAEYRFANKSLYAVALVFATFVE